MRSFFYISCTAFVVALAYWAYTENYATQAAAKRVKELQRSIAQERSAISVLNAEWAYQTRPERLRELADMNFDRLGLVPLTGQHFQDAEGIPFPENEVSDYNSPVSVQGAVETGGTQ